MSGGMKLAWEVRPRNDDDPETDYLIEDDTGCPVGIIYEEEDACLLIQAINTCIILENRNHRLIAALEAARKTIHDLQFCLNSTRLIMDKGSRDLTGEIVEDAKTQIIQIDAALADVKEPQP